MESNSQKIEFTDTEIKILIEILNYTIDNCPFEGISSEIEINHDVLRDIILKFKNSISKK
jgi:hypothetical protein